MTRPYKKRKVLPVGELLARRLQVGDPFDCWPFVGAANQRGYGNIRSGGKIHYTHRVSWEVAYGPIPDGLWVLHRCDNPPCGNWAHLFLGTQFDNMRDCAEKGRVHSSPPKGEASPTCKLTDAQVAEIRRLHALGGTTQRGLGKLYGVSQRQIWRILHDESRVVG